MSSEVLNFFFKTNLNFFPLFREISPTMFQNLFKIIAKFTKVSLKLKTEFKNSNSKVFLTNPQILQNISSKFLKVSLNIFKTLPNFLQNFPQNIYVTFFLNFNGIFIVTPRFYRHVSSIFYLNFPKFFKILLIKAIFYLILFPSIIHRYYRYFLITLLISSWPFYSRLNCPDGVLQNL